MPISMHVQHKTKGRLSSLGSRGAGGFRERGLSYYFIDFSCLAGSDDCRDGTLVIPGRLFIKYLPPVIEES